MLVIKTVKLNHKMISSILFRVKFELQESSREGLEEVDYFRGEAKDLSNPWLTRGS